MPDTIKIKGQFSVAWSSPDAFGLPYPEAFLFEEDGTTDRQSFACFGANTQGCMVPSSVERLIAEKGINTYARASPFCPLHHLPSPLKSV
jgi:hypothetical protein